MPLIEIAKVQTIGVIGCGTIGASWASAFLARGYHVRANDPDPAREAYARDYIRNAWPALVRLGLAAEPTPEAAIARFSFHTDPLEAVKGVEFVQESAFEREDIKQDLLARLDTAVREDAVISSSTSGFMPSVLQAKMRRPERLVVGHPFNPPHLVPLVEVIGGAKTAPDTVTWAIEFFRHIGKHPIRIEKEVPGHVANRLQAAIWREAVHLVNEGVASVADVDAAVAYGPGLRWAIMGPHMTFHLAGGVGGFPHFLAQLGPGVERWWADLGQPSLTPEVSAKLTAGIVEEVGDRRMDDITAARDAALIGIQEVLQKTRST